VNIIIDFDKTLTYQDTTLGLFLYRLTWSKKIICIAYYLLASILVKVKFWTVLELKSKLMAWRFSGYEKLDWLTHANSYAATIQTNKLYKTLDWEKTDFIVVSASFKEVIEVLFPTNIKILASEISFEGNVPLIGFHCFQHQKVAALANHGITKIDYLYTDSKSDLPLAKIAKEVRWVRGDCYFNESGMCIPITAETVAHAKE